MDLSHLNTKQASNQGAWLQLRNPVDNSPLFLDSENQKPMRIQLLGTDSDVYRKHSRANTDKRLANAVGIGSKLKITTALLEAEALELLAAITVQVENLTDEGATVTVDSVKQLYQKYPWIREQAEAFIEDRANFLGN